MWRLQVSKLPFKTKMHTSPRPQLCFQRMFSFPAFRAPSPADWLALPFQHREVLTEKLEVSFLCCDQSFSLGWTTPAFHGRTQKNLVCCQPSSVFKGQKKSIGSLASNAIAMSTKVKMSIGISLDHTLIITKILRKKKKNGTVLMFRSLHQSFLTWISFSFLFWQNHNPSVAPGRRGSLLRILILLPLFVQNGVHCIPCPDVWWISSSKSSPAASMWPVLRAVLAIQYSIRGGYASEPGWAQTVTLAKQPFDLGVCHSQQKMAVGQAEVYSLPFLQQPHLSVSFLNLCVFLFI